MRSDARVYGGEYATKGLVGERICEISITWCVSCCDCKAEGQPGSSLFPPWGFAIRFATRRSHALGLSREYLALREVQGTSSRALLEHCERPCLFLCARLVSFFAPALLYARSSIVTISG